MAGRQFARPTTGDCQDQVFNSCHFRITLLAEVEICGHFVITGFILADTGHCPTHFEIGNAFIWGGLEVTDHRHRHNPIRACEPDAPHTG